MLYILLERKEIFQHNTSGSQCHIVLYVRLLTRLLSSDWNIDPSQSNNVLCIHISSSYSMANCFSKYWSIFC